MRDIAIFGSYNKGSIGDKGILIGLITTILNCEEDLKITIYCMDEQDLKRELESYKWFNKLRIVQVNGDSTIKKKPASQDKVPSNIKRKIKAIARSSKLLNYLWEDFTMLRKYFSFKKFNFVSDHDLLIIGGGNLLMDLFKTWPIILYLFAMEAKKRDIPYYLVGVGALPIKRKISKYLLRKICLSAEEVRVREEISRKALKDILNIKALRSPDFVYGLSIPQNENKRKRDLGVNIAALGSKSWPTKNLDSYETYISNFAFSIFLIYKNHEFSNIRIVNTNLSDAEASKDFIDKLKDYGINLENIIYKNHNLSVQEILGEFAACKISITTRLHSSLFALLTENIVLPIVYQPKVEGVIREINKDFQFLYLNKIIEHKEYIYNSFNSLVNKNEGKYNMLPSETLEIYREDLITIMNNVLSKKILFDKNFS